MGLKKMADKLTTKGVKELLSLFQKLKKSLNADLPEKNIELWQQSQDIAKKELAGQLKEWQSGFTLRPDGNIPTIRIKKSTLKKSQQRIDQRIIQLAENKYLEKDPIYAKAIAEAEKKATNVCKKIDHLLLNFREPLLQFPRVQNSLLAVDWKKHIRNFYTSLHKDNFLYQVAEVIDILEAIKTKMERQKQTESENKLAEKEQKAEWSKIMIKPGTNKEIWEAIRSEYDVSKKNFGKKINFVSDPFKRKIIFRDVEHAFVLVSQGFSKPAVILAGGVIEELLKQYLRHKKIKPKNDRFVDYIKACEDNSLLKRGVYRLSDSIRDFRNLVHISKEETKQHTISKATAKGAVSSIFTIANDFQ